MAKLIGKLMAPNGTYIKDGEEKTSWLRCGVLLQTDKGFRVKIESLPVCPQGTDGLWLSVFEDEPRQKAAQTAAQGTPAPQQPGLDTDDIPF